MKVNKHKSIFKIGRSLKEYTDYFNLLGWHSFKPPFSGEHTDCAIAFQKKYKDEKGTKYFLTAYIYDFTEYNSAYAIEHPVGVDITTQLQDKQSRAINLTFVTQAWSIADIEKYIDKLFDEGMADYYEYEVEV